MYVLVNLLIKKICAINGLYIYIEGRSRATISEMKPLLQLFRSNPPLRGGGKWPFS